MQSTTIVDFCFRCQGAQESSPLSGRPSCYRGMLIHVMYRLERNNLIDRHQPSESPQRETRL